MTEPRSGRTRFERDSGIELRRLQQLAKSASIYHRNQVRFKRNPHLTHVVHGSLHCFEAVITLSIEIFHHVHHEVNRRHREEDSSVPNLPEERNPIFFIYPICFVTSAVCAFLWFAKKVLPDRPQISMIGCFLAAFLLLLAGIMEMKHADIYIDLTLITDEALITHPVFIHNFVMCTLSVFCMAIYLIQAWVLFDQWNWVREQDYTDDEDQDGRLSSTEIEVKTTERETPGVPNPIATLETLKSEVTHSDDGGVDDEPFVLYCCCADWYFHIKRKRSEEKPSHEFQVVHVM